MREKKKEWNSDGFASVLNEATDVEQAARPGVVVGLFADHLVENRALPGLAFACLGDDEVEVTDPLHPGFLGMDDFPSPEDEDGFTLPLGPMFIFIESGGGATVHFEERIVEVAGAHLPGLLKALRASGWDEKHLTVLDTRGWTPDDWRRHISRQIEEMRQRWVPQVVRRSGKPADEVLTIVPSVSERQTATQLAPVAPAPAKPAGNGKADGVVAGPAVMPPVAVAKPGNGNGLPCLPPEVWNRLVSGIEEGFRAGHKVLVRDLAREHRLPLLRRVCARMRAVCDFVPQADGAVEYRLRPARSR